MNRVVYSNELSHYGVLGMRWGHRRAGQGGTNKRRVPLTQDQKKSRNARIVKGAEIAAGVMAVIGAGIVADNKFAARQGLPNMIDIGKLWLTKAGKGSIL